MQAVAEALVEHWDAAHVRAGDPDHVDYGVLGRELFEIARVRTLDARPEDSGRLIDALLNACRAREWPDATMRIILALMCASAAMFGARRGRVLN